MGKMEKLFYIETIDFLTKDTFILTCINPVIFPLFVLHCALLMNILVITAGCFYGFASLICKSKRIQGS